MIEITPLGDAALTVRFGQTAAQSSDKRLAVILAAKRAIDRASIPGVVETTTSYSTLSVFLDLPVLWDATPRAEDVLDQVSARIREVLRKRGATSPSRRTGDRIDVPVCFDPSFALDLADLARLHGLKPDKAAAKFCAVDYRVACIGFLPGFPYLAGLPSELETPRRETPRISVPAGSVAIGNNQAGIYPIDSPGGWSVIGRTPLEMFDAAREPASLLFAGDSVRFRPISLQEFHQPRGGGAA